MSWYTYELIEDRRAIEQHLKQLYIKYIKECVEWKYTPMGFYWWIEEYHPEMVKKIAKLKEEIEGYEIRD